MEAELAEETLVSKGEFARRINVSAARVSQYLREGKLTHASLSGTGRMAKIRFERGCRELNHELDISQRLGNGLETQLDFSNSGGSDAQADNQAGTLAPQKIAPVADPNSPESQIKQERLRSLQFQNRKSAAEEEAARGRFMLTSDARNQMSAISAGMLQVFEGSLADLSTAISAKFKVPHRDVMHLLKAEFRKVRQKAADQARKQANEHPEIVETPVEIDA